MKKMMLPALSALGLLAACSGAADAPKEGVTAESDAPATKAAPAASAAADDDNDSVKPTDDNHAHGDGDGEHKPH